MRNRNLKTLICLMSTLKVATVLPFDALRRKMSSTVIAVYSMDVRSGLIWLASIWYFDYVIHKLTSEPAVNLPCKFVLYIRVCLFVYFVFLLNLKPCWCVLWISSVNFDVCVTLHHWHNNINSQLHATITNFIDNYNQLNMFRAIISPILRSIRLCLQLVV